MPLLQLWPILCGDALSADISVQGKNRRLSALYARFQKNDSKDSCNKKGASIDAPFHSVETVGVEPTSYNTPLQLLRVYSGLLFLSRLTGAEHPSLSLFPLVSPRNQEQFPKLPFCVCAFSIPEGEEY